MLQHAVVKATEKGHNAQCDDATTRDAALCRGVGKQEIANARSLANSACCPVVKENGQGDNVTMWDAVLPVCTLCCCDVMSGNRKCCKNAVCSKK